MPWRDVPKKWKLGTLKSGGSGKPVKSHAQMIAIMLSEKYKAQSGDKEYQSPALNGLKTAKTKEDY